MISHIQAINPCDVVSLSFHVNDLISEVKAQPDFDVLDTQQNSNNDAHEPQTIKILITDNKHNRYVAQHFSQLLFCCFRTIESLHDKNVHQSQENQKLKEQLQELQRVNEHLTQGFSLLRDQACEKIANLTKMLEELSDAKNTLQKSCQQYKIDVKIQAQQFLLKQAQIRQLYENKLNVRAQELSELNKTNEQLQQQVQELNKSLQQSSELNSQPQIESTFYLPLTHKKSDCSVFQAVDILYEEQLTGRSKVETSQSLFQDIQACQLTRQTQLKTELSTKEDSPKKSDFRNKPVLKHTMSCNEFMREGKKALNETKCNFKKNRNENPESTLKKIHSFLHSNIVKRKLKI